MTAVWRGRGGDEGAGSVLVVAVVAVALVLGGALAVAVRAHTARTLVQAAADLSALAAAQSLLMPPGPAVGVVRADGGTGDPGAGGADGPTAWPGTAHVVRGASPGSGRAAGGACVRAAEVAERHRTRLAACSIGEGGVVDVLVQVETVLGVAGATARAGPVGARTVSGQGS